MNQCAPWDMIMVTIQFLRIFCVAQNITYRDQFPRYNFLSNNWQKCGKEGKMCHCNLAKSLFMIICWFYWTVSCICFSDIQSLGNLLCKSLWWNLERTTLWISWCWHGRSPMGARIFSESISLCISLIIHISKHCSWWVCDMHTLHNTHTNRSFSREIRDFYIVWTGTCLSTSRTTYCACFTTWTYVHNTADDAKSADFTLSSRVRTYVHIVAHAQCVHKGIG